MHQLSLVKWENFEPLLTKGWSTPRASSAVHCIGFFGAILCQDIVNSEFNHQLFSAYDFHHGTSAHCTLKDFESIAALNNPLCSENLWTGSCTNISCSRTDWRLSLLSVQLLAHWGVSTCLAEIVHYPTAVEAWWSWPVWSSKLPPQLQMSLFV